MPRTVPWRWLPAAAWAVLILAVSSLPGSDLPIPPQTDKFGHLGEYGVLGVLVAWALGAMARRRVLGMAWGALAVFAALDEVHQVWIPGRSADPWDWAADASGITLGLLAVAAWRWVRRPDRSATGPR